MLYECDLFIARYKQIKSLSIFDLNKLIHQKALTLTLWLSIYF